MPLTQSRVTSSSSSSASSTSFSRISVYNDISVMHSTLSNSRAVKEKFKEMLRLWRFLIIIIKNKKRDKFRQGQL